MKVLVTGASGYLGRAVAEHLVAGRHHVRGLVRTPTTSLPPGVDVALADLTGSDQPIAEALDGVEAVVHCAAHMGGGDREIFRRVTVHGTERLLRLAAEKRVRRFVHVSSIAVYPWKRSGAVAAPHDEYDIFAPLRDHYAWSKIEAERWVQLYRRLGLLDVVVLRPGIIYGRGRSFLARLAKRLAGPLHAIAGSAHARVPLVHLTDVVEAIEHALLCPHAVATPVNVVGPDMPTQRDYLKARAAAGKEHIVPLYVPLGALRWLARRLATRCRFGGAEGKSLVYELGWLAQDVTFDLRAGADEIGWMPRIAVAEGLKA